MELFYKLLQIIYKLLFLFLSFYFVLCVEFLVVFVNNFESFFVFQYFDFVPLLIWLILWLVTYRWLYTWLIKFLWPEIRHFHSSKFIRLIISLTLSLRVLNRNYWNLLLWFKIIELFEIYPKIFTEHNGSLFLL